MNADEIFRVCNLAALVGWLILIFAGRLRWAAKLITSFVIPALLAAAYVGILAMHWGESGGNFNTLDGVMALFTNRWLVLGGWVHYLAFDLFIGSWEVRDAEKLGISHFLAIPCLLLTFLLGPAGLGMYLALRGTRGAVRIES